MRYQNFKSDFTSVHSFHVTDGGEQKQIPVPDHVRLTFFTEERRGRISVERNGDVTDGCSVSDDGMSLTAQVPLSRTFLGAGELFCEVEEIKSDPSFPQSERTEVTPTRPGITLWPGKSDNGADLITEIVLGLVVPGVVRYDAAQTLSEEERVQARTNIEAAKELPVITYGDPKDKVNAILDDFYASKIRAFVLETTNGAVCSVNVSRNYLFRATHLVKVTGADCFTLYIMVYQNGVWGTQTFENVTPYGVSYDGQALTEGRKLQARKNIDAATKAITVPYDDIAAANAAVTAYKDDPRRTLVLVNYKSILAPAFVGITDKPFISAFISEAKQIRKLLFQNGAWTESLMYVPITSGMIADSAVTETKLAKALQTKVNNNVKSVAQTLSDAEKAQARTNIGAQAELVSGTHIKTVNGKSLVGSGNVTVSGDGGGVVLLDFSENDTISLTEEQIADISDDSVTVIAVRDSGRHICTGRSESGDMLYFHDYKVYVNSVGLTASIGSNHVTAKQAGPIVEIGENISIDVAESAEILLAGETKIVSIPDEPCVFHLNVTGSTVLPEGPIYSFIGMDSPSDATGGVPLGEGCYKIICRYVQRGSSKLRYYYIFKL